jgi:hypothetical protein
MMSVDVDIGGGRYVFSCSAGWIWEGGKEAMLDDGCYQEGVTRGLQIGEKDKFETRGSACGEQGRE